MEKKVSHDTIRDEYKRCFCDVGTTLTRPYQSLPHHQTHRDSEFADPEL